MSFKYFSESKLFHHAWQMNIIILIKQFLIPQWSIVKWKSIDRSHSMLSQSKKNENSCLSYGMHSEVVLSPSRLIKTNFRLTICVYCLKKTNTPYYWYDNFKYTIKKREQQRRNKSLIVRTIFQFRFKFHILR